MSEKNMQACMAQIIEEHGLEIVHNTRVFYGMVTDLASGDLLSRERRRVKAALFSGSVEILLKACDDQNGAELYYHEAVQCLIDKTDMDERLAHETMQCMAGTLAIPVNGFQKKVAPTGQTAPTASGTARNPQGAGTQTKTVKKGSGYQPPKGYGGSHKIKYAVIAVVVLGPAAGMFFLGKGFSGIQWQWAAGIGGGAALAAVLYLLAGILDSKLYLWSPCRSLTVMIPIALAANIAARCVLGEADYGIIYKILLFWAAAGGMCNAVYCRIDVEDKFVLPNIVTAIAAGVLIFVWPESITWDFWQWVIGIGGGFLLVAAAAFLTYILDAVGPEYHQSLSVMLTIAALVNFVLLLLNGESYLIIALCFMAILIVGGIITAFMSFTEFESGYGFFNIALVIFNAGMFFVIVAGSYETFCSLVEPLYGLLKINK